MKRFSMLPAAAMIGYTFAADESVSVLRARAARNDVSAQVALGDLYDKGKGVLKDMADAMKWDRKAAEKGEPAAQASLG